MDINRKRLPQMGFFLALFVLTFTCSNLYAQTFQVSGTVVTDATGNPLPGVNIVEMGTQNGTNSDKNGEFSLQVSSQNVRLSFSFVGYKTKKINVNGRSQLTVRLKQTTSQLNNLVVTALGIKQQKKSLGYSVTEVHPEDIVTSTLSNTANLLQGQVAGVKVSQSNGGPGSAARVTIRGVSAFTGNNQPLYVVDGIPIDNSNFVSAGEYGGFAGGDGISMINPKDIKSVNVLKGASAAALYGSRARNGVVEITTKSGQGVTGGPQVEVNSTVTRTNMLSGFSDYQHKYGQGSGGQKPQNQAEAGQTGLQSWGALYDGSQVPTYFGGTSAYVYHPDQKKNFYRDAISDKNSLSLTGGNENSSYFFNTSYQNTPSIFPNSGLKRTSFTLRGTHDFLNNLHADVKANYIRQAKHNQVNLSDAPGNANYSVSFLPGNITLASLRNHYIKPDGSEYLFDTNGQGYTENPYWVVNKYSSNADKNRLIGFAKLTYDIKPWLSVIGRTGVDTYTLRRTPIVPYGTSYRPGGSLSEIENNIFENDTDFMLKLDHAITSSVNVKATFGAHRFYNKFERLGSGGNTFKVPGLQTISNIAGASPNYGFSSKQINSLYGMVKLSYNDYLFITGTGRNDWSSTLPESNNSYFYPSVSGSFVFSDAFSSVMPSWLSFGKIRASWAEVGSDTNPYQLALTYGLLPFSHGGHPLADIGPASIPLATLKPTLTKSTEVGLHMNFVNDRAGFDLALYKKNTTNQILATSISVTSGYGSRVLNAGRLDNKGIEIALNGKPLQSRNFSWNTGINFAADRSDVKALAGNQKTLQLDISRTTITTINATVGQQYGTIQGYKFKRDKNGNIVNDGGLPQRADQPTTLGRGTPSWTAGWNNTIHYKNWGLNFLFDVNWGGQIYSATNAYAYNAGLHKNTLVGRAKCDKMKKNGQYQPCFVGKGVDVNGGPNKTAVTPAAYYGQIATNVSSPFVYDANYIKFRQAKLSYTLPQSVVANSPLHSLTLSVIGRNLLYVYNSVPNVDPESAINAGNGQGLELASVPGSRSIGLNIDIKF